MDHNENEHLADFVEDAARRHDPNDHYVMQQVASGQVAINDDDENFRSAKHFVGRFWVVEPRNGNPELARLRTHSQNSTVAARAMADRKTVGQRS